MLICSTLSCLMCGQITINNLIMFFIGQLVMQDILKKNILLLYQDLKYFPFYLLSATLFEVWSQGQQLEQGGPDISFLSPLFLLCQGQDERQSPQHVLHLPQDLLPVGRAQNTSLGRCLRGILAAPITVSTGYSQCGGAVPLLQVSPRKLNSLNLFLIVQSYPAEKTNIKIITTTKLILTTCICNLIPTFSTRNIY